MSNHQSLPGPSDQLATWRQEEMNRQMKELTGRDVQLWSIMALITLVLTAGFLSVIAPSLNLNAAPFHIEQRYLPQVFFGLVALIVLFNVYVLTQRRTLATTRWQLIQEMIANEKLASVSLIDPLTQVLNRQSMDLVVSRELARANRLGTDLTFLLLELRRPRQRAANAEDRLGGDTARVAKAGSLLRHTFRGLDTVIRYSQDSFLIVMPDTSEQQAEIALQRLTTEIDNWNLTSRTGVEITLDSGLAPYIRGAQVEDVVRNAARRMALKRNNLGPLMPDFTLADPTPVAATAILEQPAATEAVMTH